MKTLNRSIPILNTVSALLLLSLFGMIFFYAPPEATMGNVHRLFYIHVGTAWAASVTFFAAMIFGGLYLRSRDEKWDMLSLSSVEIGLVFFTMTIAAGSIWGRPAWNVWWDWSPRLIGVTVTWLTYIGYLILRGAIEDPQRRARFAAIYVFMAFVTVLITYSSVRFLRDIHPVVVGEVSADVAEANAAQGAADFRNGLEKTRMLLTLNFSWVVFSVIYITWLANRYRLEKMRREADQLKARVTALLTYR
ncbi:MAG TPA: hypothetical protein ENJ56_02320 [Anaerolineae bacterium]|nr:hypothetical protein [Anaerolineae bacterium]